MREQKTPKRKQYLNDFKQNEKGEYVYTGKLHHFQSEQFTYQQATTRMSLYMGCMVICAMVAGLFPAAGTMNTFYVLIPYMTCLVTICIFAYKYVSFLFGKQPLRDYIYQRTVKQFPSYLHIVRIMAAIAVMSELVYVGLHGAEGYLATTILYLVCMIGVFVACILWLRDMPKYQWNETK